MAVEFSLENVGTFYKTADNTTIPGVLPLRVNTDPKRYGDLKEPLDLLLGCKNFQDLGFDDRFDSISDYLMRTNEPGVSLKDAVNAEFVTSRRNLVNIAASVYSSNCHKIQAIRKNGVVFLNDMKEVKRDKYQNPRGYKFELYMTLDENGNPFDDMEPARNDESTKAVFRNTLKSAKESINLFYVAEIDAVNSYGDFIEMKTTYLTGDDWRMEKSLDVYLQALFGNCFQIIFGIKGRGSNCSKNCVYKVFKKFTAMLPGECERYWNQDECMQRLFSTLQKIQTILQNDGDSLVLTIENRDVKLEPETLGGCSFLSQKFLEHFR